MRQLHAAIRERAAVIYWLCHRRTWEGKTMDHLTPDFARRVSAFLLAHPGASMPETGALIAPEASWPVRMAAVVNAERFGLLTRQWHAGSPDLWPDAADSGHLAALMATAAGYGCYLARRQRPTADDDTNAGDPAGAALAGNVRPLAAASPASVYVPRMTRATFEALERIAANPGRTKREAIDRGGGRHPDSRKYDGVSALIKRGLVTDLSPGRYSRLYVTPYGQDVIAMVRRDPAMVAGPLHVLIGGARMTAERLEARRIRDESEREYRAAIVAYFAADCPPTLSAAAIVLRGMYPALSRKSWHSRIVSAARDGAITLAPSGKPAARQAWEHKIAALAQDLIAAHPGIAEAEVTSRIMAAAPPVPPAAMRGHGSYDDYLAAIAANQPHARIAEVLQAYAHSGAWLRQIVNRRAPGGARRSVARLYPAETSGKSM